MAQKVLVLGSGPIVIGQACEFDYSGTLALKALRKAGFQTIILNSNPATIMTDESFADKTYIEPLTLDTLKKVIKLEQPKYLLPTMAGQTGLNLSRELAEDAEFQDLNITVWAASPSSIAKAEDRLIFRNILEQLGLPYAKSMLVTSISQFDECMETIGVPSIIRPSYTLGGEGSGYANTKEELRETIARGLELSPVSSVLVEQSLLHWEEFEIEVIRDRENNYAMICSIENIDPMGVHTGDSITVAPAMTLPDDVLQKFRTASHRILDAVGLETGGCNVQFALSKDKKEFRVIEINPRVSRSSALASKATGYPIAKVATQLATGKRLYEIPNDITGTTPASFEPSLDYVVCKIPRFNHEKFQLYEGNPSGILNSSMKSVGEVMGLGRTFVESFLKSVASVEQQGFDLTSIHTYDENLIRDAHPRRILHVLHALEKNISVEEIHRLSGINFWFLGQLKQIAEKIREYKKKDVLDKVTLREAKEFGFTDKQLADLFDLNEVEVLKLRWTHKIHPSIRLVDSVAGEHLARTPYYYLSYSDSNHPDEITQLDSVYDNSVLILGSGPNRIGQGIEFDYSCVHACFGVKKLGLKAIMLNCNPETVSTDYDTANILFFDPITFETVKEIFRVLKPKGVFTQFGGQTPLKLSKTFDKEGIKILGTQFGATDLAESRSLFSNLCRDLNIKQPDSFIARDLNDALSKIDDIGFPCLIRPSYVLGGRGMYIIYNSEHMKDVFAKDESLQGASDILIDSFLTHAKEVDIDLLCDGTDAIVCGLMEHIEEAGVHSGDSTAILPSFSLGQKITDEIRSIAKKLAIALQTRGLINVQLAIQNYDIYVLEANPRASRTVPFISKALRKPIVEWATQICLGATLKELNLTEDLDLDLTNTYVKKPVFPFSRFKEVDPLLGPEMKSTGEVMGWASTLPLAYSKALKGAGVQLPKPGSHVFLSIRREDKPFIVDSCRNLIDMGFYIEATEGTAEFLNALGIPSVKINKSFEGGYTCVDAINDGRYGLVINTAQTLEAIRDSYIIRRRALEKNISCVTTVAELRVLVQALREVYKNPWSIQAMQDRVDV